MEEEVADKNHQDQDSHVLPRETQEPDHQAHGQGVDVAEEERSVARMQGVA